MSLKSYTAICAECETLLPVDSRYCPNCKTPTSDGILRCAVCRNPIKPGDLNCGHCNAILTPLAVPVLEENEINEEQNYISGDGDAFASAVRSSVELPVLSEDMIGGKYKVVRRIGRGGFGTVYEVDKILRGSLLRQALKIAVANEQCDSDAVAKIIHEFNIGGQVDVIANVVKPESPDSCSFKGRELVMLPMPLADGGNLRQWLGKNRDSENYKENAIELFRQVCSGVREIHKAGIMHLDIKPENILLFSRNEAEEIDSNIAKIADFGIARHYKDKFGENPKELLKQGIGTPEYMSPEQFLVAHQEDIKETSDIYSLGIVLFEILAGRRPFDGDFDSLRKKHLDSPPPLLEGKLSPYWEITKRCIEKKTKARYQDMDQLLNDLSRAKVGFYLNSEVACPECGHVNEDVKETYCELNDKHKLPADYFRHKCMRCSGKVRIDQEDCPFCGLKGVGAYYRLEDRKKTVERLKDEDVEESIRLLEIILQDGAGEYEERASLLITELRQKQPKVKALIKEASEQKLAGEIEDAINTLRKILTLVHRHRIALTEKEHLERLLRNLKQKPQDALIAMDEARFTEAENILLECLKDAPNHKNTKEIFETCLERAQIYTSTFKDAEQLVEEGIIADAKIQLNLALSEAPKSEEALSLNEKIQKTVQETKRLIQHARNQLTCAEFSEADKTIAKIEEKQIDDNEVSYFKKQLTETRNTYVQLIKKAKSAISSHDLNDALKIIKKVLELCPGSSEAKALSEQTGSTLAKCLIQEAHSDIKAARFEKAEDILNQSEQLCAVTEELDKARELLRDTENAYDEHMWQFRTAKINKDLKTALKEIDAAVKICPDSEEAKKLKNDIEALKADREKWRAELKENIIAAIKWLIVLIPGIAGIVMLLLYTQPKIGSIAIGIGILAGILNCIRETGVYNALSNRDFIKGEAKPAIFLISLLLVVSGTLSVTTKPLLALSFPVLAVVYSFSKELAVVNRLIISQCKTGINKAKCGWGELGNKSKAVCIIVGFLFVVILCVALFAGVHHWEQKRKLLAEFSNATATQVAGNWEDATILYEKLLARKPDDTSFKNALTVCQYMIKAETSKDKGKLDEALAHCQNARNLTTVPAIIAVIDSKTKDISNEKGRIAKITALLAEARTLKNKGELDRSLSCITEVLTLDPNNAKAKQLQVELTPLIEQERFRKLMAEAVNHETQVDWEKAIEVYNQVMIIKPDNSDVKGKLAECYHNLNVAKAGKAENKGELSEAIDYYTKALSYKQVPLTQVALESAKGKLAKVNQLLTYAKFNDNKENYEVALRTLKELLNLAPIHTEAKELYQKIFSNYISTDIGWWISRAKSAATVINDTDQKALVCCDITVVQAKAGDIDGAKTTASHINRAEQKSFAYCSIVAAQADVGDIAGAKITATKITGHENSHLRIKSIAYCNIAKAQAKMGNMTTARETFEQAKAIVDNVSGDTYSGSVYSEITEAQVEAKDIIGAKATAAKIKCELFGGVAYQKIVAGQVKLGDVDGAKATVMSITDNRIRKDTFIAIAKVMLKNGDMREAKALVEYVGDSKIRDCIYRVIVKAQLDVGDIMGAICTAENISEGFEKDKACCAIADAQAKNGDITGAKATAARLSPHSSSEFSIYNLIAKAQAKMGDLGAARKTFMKNRAVILDFISNVERGNKHKEFISGYKTETYIDIARTQAWIQDYAEAKVTAANINDSNSKDTAYCAIAEVQAEAGDIAGAKVTVETTSDSELKNPAYIAIAKAQSKIENFTGAMITATKISDNSKRKENFSAIVKAKAKTSTPEMLLLWIESLENDLSRTYAYLYVAEGLLGKTSEFLESKDDAKNVGYYRKAADAGDSNAMYQLGQMYEEGKGVAMDWGKAIEWYRKAAEAGDSDGMNSLGVMYREGKGVTKDYKKAVEWYRKAAEAGHSGGMCNLGVRYMFGEGVSQNSQKAIEWYRKAADAGHSHAMYLLGWMYDSDGVVRDREKAVKWYRKATEAGHTAAMRELGEMYHKGRGLAKDYKKAMEWYRKAAEAGDSYAMSSLGWMYLTGDGVVGDYKKAVEWFRKAARLGHESAQQNLTNFGETW